MVLKDIEDREVELSDYKGKVVVLDFWATWCEPCGKAVEVINQWKNSVPSEQFVFVGINTDEKEEIAKIKKHTEDLKMEYPSLLDPNWKLTQNYEIDGLPCVLVFNKKGELVYRQYGINATDLPGLIIRSKVWGN